MICIHVFALVGKSGTGKTTLQKESGLTIPQQYTTRSRRGDEGGYIFLTKDEFIRKIDSSEIIFPNYIYGNFYGISKDDISKNVSCVVLDIIGLLQCIEEFGEENVTGIMIDAPGYELIERMMKRGSTQQEIEKRLSCDSIKFKHAYNLCQYKVTNDSNVNDAILYLRGIIEEVLKEKGE